MRPRSGVNKSTHNARQSTPGPGTALRPCLEVFRIKIVLNEINPPVWRRVLISSDTSLSDLHLIIQSTMGWRNDGAHCFVKDSDRLAPRSTRRANPNGGISVCPALSYHDAVASNLFTAPGDVITYTYSSGDGWSHRLIYEETVARDKDMGYPRCVGGARTCPPESCNGTVGYLYMLEALRNPFHPEHEFMLNRYGAYDPDAFDATDINERYLEEDYGCY